MDAAPPRSGRREPPGALDAEDLASEGEAARLPAPGEIVAERYRVDAMLGRGGMGAVLAATHTVTGKRFAIKWVLPRGDARAIGHERLLREARLAGRIDHPNVVRVLDVGEHRGSIFLVMELLRGELLKARIERGPLPVEDAIRLIMPVLRGVAAAHAVGIVHRDLKPDNVVLARADDDYDARVRPVVLDFGISRGLGDAPGDLTLTQTGIMVGTPLYMAPEQLAGAVEVDPRYDVYALGVILYELVTGARPFDGETYALLVSAKLREAPIPPRAWRPDLDPRFEKVLLRAMETRPRTRFESVEALAAALEPFGGGCSFSDRDPTWRAPLRELELTVRSGPRPRPRARRWPPPRWSLALALVIAAGVVAGVAMATAGRAAQPEVVVLGAPLEAEAETETEPETETEAVTEAGTETEAGAEAAAQTEAGSEAEPVAPEAEPEVGATPARRGRARRGRTGRLRVSEF